jgi:putative aldouronate transport system substrate-binding protein
MIAISKKAGDAGKLPYIAKFLEWAITDGYYMLGWGQEGVNYLLDAEGIPTVNGLADPSKGFTKSGTQPLLQLKGLAYYWSDAELKSRYPSYVTAVSKKPMSALTTLRKMQSMPWTKQAGVDLLPAANVDLDRFYGQSVVEFVNENKPLNPETWKQFVAEFDKLGGKAWEDAGISVAKEAGILTK